jgi:hypothetical protein
MRRHLPNAAAGIAVLPAPAGVEQFAPFLRSDHGIRVLREAGWLPGEE